MTRFARAKGSKASNERLPEEATPWSEMKKSLLSRKKNEVENQSLECIPKNDEGQKCSEWAPIGDDSYSESLLKRHVKNKNKGGSKMEVGEEKGEVKTKRKILDTNGKLKKGNKKRQMSSSEGSKDKVKKKNVLDTNDGVIVIGKLKKGNKKRQMLSSEEYKDKVKKKKKKKVADDSEGKPPKKKKKLEETVVEQTDEKKCNEVEVKSNEKSKEKKAETKFKSEKIKKKVKRNLDENRNTQFQSKFSERSKGKSEFQRKKTKKGSSGVEELIINGEKIEIVKFQGFFVTLEDAERLKKLRSDMKKEGIPRDKLEAAIKLERRRAEKALSRLKKSVCFHCRGHGHLLSNCPDLVEKETTGVGICYKCGSTEHSAAECKVVRGSSYQFAECFICKEQGHIARQCPDNPRGLYPQGGACRECGDVTHLRKDCPNVLSKKEEEAVTVGLRNDRNLECLDEEIAGREKKRNSAKTVKKNSTVKF